MNNPIYKRALCNLLLLVVSLALVRFTRGWWLAVMTLLGFVWAFSGKSGKALSMYFIIIAMVVINPIILPKGAIFSYIVRFGPLLIGLALMLKGVSLRGQARVPLGMLVVYLMVAAISSMGGWAPLVSYLKIVNFLVFILGFWFGLHILSYDREGAVYLRATFLAFVLFLIGGSALLLPFPGISTLSGIQLVRMEGGVEAANLAVLGQESGAALFCGVTNQSQAFAPLCALAISWLLADMLFVEQKFSKPHLIMMALGVPLLYMSRSRTGLLTLMVGIAVIALYLPRKVSLPIHIRRHLKTGVSAILVLGFIVMVFSEISSGSISQWLRKTDRVKEDSRTLSDALMQSRQGLIDESMSDFHRNPIFGSGFQVAEYTAEMVARSRSSLIISASIEKGVLPVMILGETGIVGGLVFAFFLISFYSTCSRRKLHVTAALFTVLLASNMGEATFFSPGGIGGLLWAMSIFGGYVIDNRLLHNEMYNPYLVYS